MTKVIISKDKNGSYKQLTCNGHAGFAEAGSDVVCAAVSVLVINTINSLEELAGESFDVATDETEGFINCDFKGPLQEKSIFLLDSLVFGLKNIQKEYGAKYLQVKFKEV
ncbi:MAG: ribosomal-processing cysteine protease Prp [Lachnospiraceae bacterium]|nr:ribosomal-processing cysteine protease Prp [Lachnospiraceae bacterium]MBQ7781270.1 ribosomal-processing cysteine protease Prp [Lachnospiraceae bacterium]